MVAEQAVNSPNYPSPSTTTTDLRSLITDIFSLISLSHTIRVFSVKWQLIRTKLEELNTTLIATQNCFNHYTNNKTNINMQDEIIHPVISCLSRIKDLSTKCINESFSGKLLMQSDLDRILARLDQVLNIVTRCYYKQCGTTGFALVVSKPGVGASREDMRFYVQDLLIRVKIGDGVMRREAVELMNEVVEEDEKYVKVLVDVEDLVLQIVGLLGSEDWCVQEGAVKIVSVVSGYECYRGVLVNAGIVSSLIRVVDCEKGSDLAKEKAVFSLKMLTEGGDNGWALSAHGGVTVLLGLLCGEVRGEVVSLACGVLRNVVGVEEIKRFMVEEGVVGILIKLIKSKVDDDHEVVMISAIELLQGLACGSGGGGEDDGVRDLIVREGGVKGLIRVLDLKPGLLFKLKETALRAIENLCFGQVDYVNLIIGYGFLIQLLGFLRKGDVSIQELAFKSACRLAGASEEARKAMGDAGFMQEFVKFLEAKSYDIREMAAEALSIMVLVPKNKKKFALDDRNLVLVLQLLDPKEGNSGNIKFLLSILMSLSSCNHARRKIASSGYVKNLEKLADAGVTDAKKIVRKISTNRFKSMLNGIWH